MINTPPPPLPIRAYHRFAPFSVQILLGGLGFWGLGLGGAKMNVLVLEGSPRVVGQLGGANLLGGGATPITDIWARAWVVLSSKKR